MIAMCIARRTHNVNVLLHWYYCQYGWLKIGTIVNMAGSKLALVSIWLAQNWH